MNIYYMLEHKKLHRHFYQRYGFLNKKKLQNQILLNSNVLLNFLKIILIQTDKMGKKYYTWRAAWISAFVVVVSVAFFIINIQQKIDMKFFLFDIFLALL